MTDRNIVSFDGILEGLTLVKYRMERAKKEDDFRAVAAYGEALFYAMFQGLCPLCRHRYIDHQYQFEPRIHTCKEMVNETTICNCHADVAALAVERLAALQNAGVYSENG